MEMGSSRSTLPRKAPAVVPAAVARHAKVTPNRPAIVGPDETWTYADLDARICALHERLRHAGVLHGDRVIVALDRGPDLVAAILAASRAGATYVPVDPAHPPARIEAVTAQAAPRVAFADGVGVSVLPPSLEVIRTDEPQLLDPVPPSPVPVFPEAAAYMLFTSGSTGRPKGVVIPHRALETFLSAIAERLGMGPDDRVLAATTLGFDISVLEVHVPLLLGATLDMVSSAVRGHPGRLAAYVADHPLTVVQATPTNFRLLIKAGWKGRPDLKVLCGGEAMTPELAQQLLERGGEVWNLYGPTECTVWATAHRVTREAPTPFLGDPLYGTRLMIVDADGRLSDDGELIIGGFQVGTGYFRDPVKTDAAFIEDIDAPGQLAYRTGDRVTQTAEGLVFRGRLDSQVKVRGVRVELGGVEAHLLTHPAVAQCAVLHDAGRDELVAYGVIADGADTPSADELRAHLEPTTYRAAWPAQYVWLTAMPLTATGKIDRKALVGHVSADIDLSVGDGAPPTNDIEWLVAKAWRQVLKLPCNPSRNDSFVALGGTSLKGLELVLRLEKWIEVEIPTAAFMVCRTVAEQAALLEESRDEPLNAVPLAEGEGIPLFALCGVQLYQALAGALEGFMPFYGMSVPLERAMHETKPGHPEMAPSVQDLAKECEEAILAVRPTGPYRLAGSSFGGVIAFEVARRLQARGQVVEVVALFDSLLPFALHSSVARRVALYALRSRMSQRAAGYVRAWLGRSPAPEVRAIIPAGETGWNEAAKVSLARYLSTLHDTPDLPVLLIRALDRTEGRGQWVDPDLGWSRLIRGSAVVREAPGDHLSILSGDGAKVCAEAIGQFLGVRRRPADSFRKTQPRPSAGVEVAA